MKQDTFLEKVYDEIDCCETHSEKNMRKIHFLDNIPDIMPATSQSRRDSRIPGVQKKHATR